MCRARVTEKRGCGAQDCETTSIPPHRTNVNKDRSQKLTPSLQLLQNVPRLIHSAETCDLNENVLFWMLPRFISQSKFGDRQTQSNACTIITLAMADIFCRFDVQLPRKDAQNNWELSRPRKELHPQFEYSLRNNCFAMPEDIVRVLVNGIIDGNTAHKNAMDKRISQSLSCARNSSTSSVSKDNDEIKDTFTVPQALDAILATTGSRVHEIDFISVTGDLQLQLPNQIETAINSPHLCHLPNVTMVLIVLERAVLLVYQRDADTVSVFDSHTHRRKKENRAPGDVHGYVGAVVGCGSGKRLHRFTSWLVKYIFPELLTRKTPVSYELSVIQTLGPSRDTDAPNVTFKTKVRQRIFKKGSHKLNAVLSTSQSGASSQSMDLDRSISGIEEYMEEKDASLSIMQVICEAERRRRMNRNPEGRLRPSLDIERAARRLRNGLLPPNPSISKSPKDDILCADVIESNFNICQDNDTTAHTACSITDQQKLAFSQQNDIFQINKS